MYHVYLAATTRTAFDATKTDGGTAREQITRGQPTMSSDVLEDVRKHAKLYVLEHPRETVYIVEQDRVLEWIRNERFDEMAGQYEDRIALLVAHLVLLSMYVLATAFFDYGIVGLLGLAGIMVLYHLIWRLGIQNIIEAAVLCAIFLILFLIMIPSLAKAREKAQRASPPAPATAPAANTAASTGH